MSGFFKPEFLTIFKEGYNFSFFRKDLLSGFIVGIITLPMCLAFAVAAGARPEQGLYSAIIAGFLISFLGGSRYQISGPSGSFAILIYTILQRYGYEGLMISTILAGMILVMMGICRMGAVIKFIPYPVTIGLTSGLAVILFSGQIPDFLGLNIQQLPRTFIDRWILYVEKMGNLNPYSIAIGILTIGILLYWPRITSKVPGSLVAIFFSTFLVQLFHLPIETIGDRFGNMPSSFPIFKLPSWNWGLISELISPALSIALLGGIESLLTAVVADGLTGKKHKPDQELISLGLGNIVSMCFNGLPACGSISRTTANIKNGGKTPLAGMFHAMTLLLITLYCGKMIFFIPMVVLSAILILIAYNMCAWRHFSKLFLSPKQDIVILLVTFFLTVFSGIVFAVQAGMILTAFLFMHSMSNTLQARYLKREGELTQNSENHNIIKDLSKDIEVFEVHGPLFFAATEKFKTALSQIHKSPKVLILKLHHVLTIDATGIKALEDLIEKTKKEGTTLLLSGVKEHLKKLFLRSGILTQLQKEPIFLEFDKALEYANTIIKNSEIDAFLSSQSLDTVKNIDS